MPSGCIGLFVVKLPNNALLVELAGGVLPRIGNDMWASRTVAPKRVKQPAAGEPAAVFAPPPTSGPAGPESPAERRRTSSTKLKYSVIAGF